MKGAIVNCLKETIISKFGQQKWEEIMVNTNQRPNQVILATIDIDDNLVMDMVKHSCKALNHSLEEVADMFGDYWMNTFALKMYRPYYGSDSSAKEFFTRLNDIHHKVTKNINNAMPPRFDLEWKNESTLQLTYHSSRGLIDFVVGLAKGVGNYFNQKLEVRKISSANVEIKFL